MALFDGDYDYDMDADENTQEPEEILLTKTHVAQDLLDRCNSMTNDEVMASLRILGLKEKYMDRDSKKMRNVELKNYQLMALRFALSRRRVPGHDTGGPIGCLLALDMGLGKTLVALCVILVFKYAHGGPCIVTCPSTIKRQWINDAYIFFGATFEIILADDYKNWLKSSRHDVPLFDKRVTVGDSALQRCDIFIISTDSLRACWSLQFNKLVNAKGPSTAKRKQLAGVTPTGSDMSRDIVEWVLDSNTGHSPAHPKHQLTTEETTLTNALEWKKIKSESRSSKPIPIWTEAASRYLHPILRRRWSVQVIDESHDLRNCLQKFYACIFMRVERFTCLLSGTSIVNSPVDLWAQLCCCRCSHIPSHKIFKGLCDNIKKAETELDGAVTNTATNIIRTSLQGYQEKLDTLLTPHMMSIRKEDTTSRTSPESDSVQQQGTPTSVHSGDSSSSSSSGGDTCADSSGSDSDTDDTSSSDYSSSSSSSSDSGSSDDEEGDVCRKRPAVRIAPEPREPLHGVPWWTVADQVMVNTSVDRPKKRGAWFIYSEPTADLPVAYCQNVLLKPSQQLEKALMAATQGVKATLDAKMKGMAKMSSVLKAISLMRQLSESWKYPTDKLRDFLLSVPGLNWTPDLPHPKSIAVLHYFKSYVRDGEKLLVYCYFKGSVRDTSEVLAKNGVKHIALTGDNTDEERTRAFNRFQRDPVLRVLVTTHITQCGVNLQSGSHVIMEAAWWNGKGDDQGIGRVLRIGQKHDAVYATWFTLTSLSGMYRTVEEVMVDKCITKQKVGSELEALVRVFDQIEDKHDRSGKGLEPSSEPALHKMTDYDADYFTRESKKKDSFSLVTPPPPKRHKSTIQTPPGSGSLDDPFLLSIDEDVNRAKDRPKTAQPPPVTSAPPSGGYSTKAMATMLAEYFAKNYERYRDNQVGLPLAQPVTPVRQQPQPSPQPSPAPVTPMHGQQQQQQPTQFVYPGFCKREVVKLV